MSKHNNNHGMGRRLFLKMAGAVALCAGFPATVWAFFIKKFPVRSVERNDWVFEPASGQINFPGGSPEPYMLTVDGLVENPFKMTYQELQNIQQVEQVSDFHCVEGWSVADLKWGGFRFEQIVSRARPKPEAQFAVFHAMGKTGSKPGGLDHYIESFPLERLLDPKAEVVLALNLNNEPIPHEHGAPLRVLSPYDLAYKSIKFVHRIEFTDKQQPGWWTLANPIYPVDAPVPKKRLRKK
jgi:DMSO/TMAO reductase YedYZ molybdopterin-dependent catalytic subunit